MTKTDAAKKVARLTALLAREGYRELADDILTTTRARLYPEREPRGPHYTRFAK